MKYMYPRRSGKRLQAAPAASTSRGHRGAPPFVETLLFLNSTGNLLRSGCITWVRIRAPRHGTHQRRADRQHETGPPGHATSSRHARGHAREVPRSRARARARMCHGWQAIKYLGATARSAGRAGNFAVGQRPRRGGEHFDRSRRVHAAQRRSCRHTRSADKLRHDATKPCPLTWPWQRRGQHSGSDAPRISKECWNTWRTAALP